MPDRVISQVAAGVSVDTRGVVGERVMFSVAGVGRLRGAVVRVGADWLLADDGTHEWLVRLAAVEEVRGLRQAGFGGARALEGLGYKQLGAYLDGACDLAQATAETIRATVAYARRQRTWFRNQLLPDEVVHVTGMPDEPTDDIVDRWMTGFTPRWPRWRRT